MYFLRKFLIEDTETYIIFNYLQIMITANFDYFVTELILIKSYTIYLFKKNKYIPSCLNFIII